MFLVADTQLYRRLCPSVHPLVHWSVGSGYRFDETSIFDTFCEGLSVGGGLGCEWGLDAPAHSSATILWPRVTCSQLSLYFERSYTHKMHLNFLVADTRLYTVGLSVGPSHFLILSGFCTTAPVQPSATRFRVSGLDISPPPYFFIKGLWNQRHGKGEEEEERHRSNSGGGIK